MKYIELAKNGAHDLLEQADRDLESGRIDEAQWFAQVQAVITPAYRSAKNPRAQSGHSGDEARWEQARSLILDAVDDDGSFLDIGCANGHLIESLQRWNTRKGIELDLYGLDIAPELVALAKERIPDYAPKLFVGNALYWQPPQTFRYVRTGLEYVPRSRVAAYLEKLWKQYLASPGRLIVGTYNEECECRHLEDLVTALGYVVTGRSEREHRDQRLRYRVLWVDRK